MSTPAGWYPEPDGRQQRYWDGEKWTEHVAPWAQAPAAADQQPAAAVPLATDGTASDPDGGSSRGKVLGGIAAAVLVAIGGYFAFTQLAGADGGSDSPEAAVESLMGAFSDEDLVGVAETVLPGERRTYIDPSLEAIGRLQEWGVLADDLDTSDIAGVDFEIEGLELRTEEVADDVVNVYVSGSMTAELDGEELPIGEVVESRMDEDPADLDEPAETAEFSDVLITTVQDDGRWYVSAMYTVAETARAESDLSMPDGIEPIGADSPEAAVDGFIDAASDLDLEEMVARLDPDEAAALQRYAPLFLDDAQAELDASIDDADLTIDIEVEQEVTMRDDIAIVTFPSFSARVEGDGEVAEVTFDGECTTITAEDETEEICVEDGSGSTIDFSDTPAGDLTAIFEDMEPVGLVVAQHDGEWYVSPIRTYSEAILSVMRAIDGDEFEQIIDAIEDGSLEQWFEDELEGQFEEMFDEFRSDFDSEDCVSSSSSSSSSEGDDVGDCFPDPDPDIDLSDLVAACESGDMEACDDLYWESDIGSPEEDIALTCGGTVPEGEQAGGSCATGEPNMGEADAYGDDPELDAMWDGCAAGDMDACDDLFWSSGVGTQYEAFATTCGERRPTDQGTFGDCVSVLGEQVG